MLHLYLKLYPITVILLSICHIFWQKNSPLGKVTVVWLENNVSWLKIIWHIMFVVFWNIPRVGLIRTCLWILGRDLGFSRLGWRAYLETIIWWSMAVYLNCRLIYFLLLRVSIDWWYGNTEFSIASYKLCIIAFLNARNLGISAMYCGNSLLKSWFSFR